MSMFTTLALVAMLTCAFSLYVFSFMLDDQIAMSQCMKHHSYNSCHYSIYH